jgi:hypothetical protein
MTLACSNFKISAVKNIYSLVLYIIDGNVYEIYKGYQTRKNKKQSGEKRWLFEEIISHYGILLEL